MKLADVRYLKRELEEYTALRTALPRMGSLRSDFLDRHLSRRAEELAGEYQRIVRFIEGIPDPELRLIFELRYFRGESWQGVAKGLPVLLSADGARMKHDRYLRSVSSKKVGSTG